MTMRKLRPDMTRKEAVRAYRQLAADLATAEAETSKERQTAADLFAVIARIGEALGIPMSTPYLCQTVEARAVELVAENESLRASLTAAEADLEDFVTEAVEQNCGVPNTHGIRIFSHSFMATYEGWIEFLVQRGRMRRLDPDRELYVFVDELTSSKEAPANPD